MAYSCVQECAFCFSNFCRMKIDPPSAALAVSNFLKAPLQSVITLLGFHGTEGVRSNRSPHVSFA